MNVRRHLVPILAVSVACVQVVCAGFFGLTPWRGGGYGMFATIDTPAKRILVLQVTDDRGQNHRVDLTTTPRSGSLSQRSLGRAATFPLPSRLERIADSTLAIALEPIQGGAPSAAAPMDVRLSDGPPTAETIRARTVSITVLKPVVDRATWKISLRHVMGLRASAGEATRR